MKGFRREEIAESPALPVHWLQPVKASEEFATRSLRGVSAVKAALCSLSPGHPVPHNDGAGICRAGRVLPQRIALGGLGRGCAVPWPSGRVVPCHTLAGVSSVRCCRGTMAGFQGSGLGCLRAHTVRPYFSPVLLKLSQSSRNPFLRCYFSTKFITCSGFNLAPIAQFPGWPCRSPAACRGRAGRKGRRADTQPGRASAAACTQAAGARPGTRLWKETNAFFVFEESPECFDKDKTSS